MSDRLPCPTFTGLVFVTLTVFGGMAACHDSTAPAAQTVASIRLVPDSPTVGVLDTLRITALPLDAAGNVVSGKHVSWSVETPGTLTIDSTGLARGLQKGSVTIRVTVDSQVATAGVTVRYLFAQLGAGTDYTCAVTTGHQAFCWGANSEGQLGTGSTFTDTVVPVLVDTSSPVLEIRGNESSGGERFTCALHGSLQAECSGLNGEGELGDGSFGGLSATPQAVAGGLAFSRVEVGNVHACALGTTGAAYCWGYNSSGQLGVGDTLNRDAPTLVTGGLQFSEISLGTYNTCAIRADDQTAYCWGANPNQEYGVDTTGASLVPRLVSDTLHFAHITSGTYHACGITTDGRALCWGGNHEGQLGWGDTSSSVTPVPVAGGYTFTSIASGTYHSCAVATGGTTYCWGYNATSQLGVSSGTTGQSYTPVALAGSLKFTQLSGGYGHTCGVTTTHDLYCWGDNSEGQLGHGHISGGPTPVQVTSP